MMIVRVTPRVVAVCLALVSSALLAGCADPQPAAPGGSGAPATTLAPATTAPATGTPSTTAPATGAPTKATTAAASQTATPGVEPVSCGPVGPEGGAQVDLIAESTEAGRVGCTEAINVITEYYRDAGTKAEGTGRHLVVQGWNCLADTGAYGSGAIGCDKDGFAFHTQP